MKTTKQQKIIIQSNKIVSKIKKITELKKKISKTKIKRINENQKKQQVVNYVKLDQKPPTAT